MEKSIEEINRKIREGNVRVVTADEMPRIIGELGEEGALEEVDVVTTGTFGAMCSSGAFLNFGHADPPIRMERVWLNDVEAYGGIAAVDAYIGVTQQSETRGDEYGGAHVMEDLVSGAGVELHAISRGTDCYPRRSITTELKLEDLNQAVMVNPRNSYQRYNAATNSTDRTLFTYMGTLLPNYGNVSFSGAGSLSPLQNDPKLRTIGSGTPIFLCGARGIVVGEGTQHSPGTGFGTLMVSGDMKQMSRDFLRAATMQHYGVTLYVGLGVAIPLLDLDMVRSTGVRDEDIGVDILDYGVPRRSRPTVKKVTYAELKSGRVELMGEEVKTSSLSSYRFARRVATTLREWIERGKFELSLPTQRLNSTKVAMPMKETEPMPTVKEIMSRMVHAITEDESIKTAARKLLRGDTNHLVVLDHAGRLVGIVTTYDISKSVVQEGRGGLVKDIMTRQVIRTTMDEHLDIAAQKLERYNISALPVVDRDSRVVGMLTAIDLGKLLERRWKR
ncbi:MAG: homocysteine biosynthesis protein [Methanomicrobiales archaeon]|nr:homocysteine biosynthesis protein [Methanomicrobiales archaeon]